MLESGCVVFGVLAKKNFFYTLITFSTLDRTQAKLVKEVRSSNG